MVGQRAMKSSLLDEGWYSYTCYTTPDVPEDVWLGGDVLVEPAVDQHVANGGAHGHQVETEEREVVIPGGGLGGENIYHICICL